MSPCYFASCSSPFQDLSLLGACSLQILIGCINHHSDSLQKRPFPHHYHPQASSSPAVAPVHQASPLVCIPNCSCMALTWPICQRTGELVAFTFVIVSPLNIALVCINVGVLCHGWSREWAVCTFRDGLCVCIVASLIIHGVGNSPGI